MNEDWNAIEKSVRVDKVKLYEEETFYDRNGNIFCEYSKGIK